MLGTFHWLVQGHFPPSSILPSDLESRLAWLLLRALIFLGFCLGLANREVGKVKREEGEQDQNIYPPKSLSQKLPEARLCLSAIGHLPFPGHSASSFSALLGSSNHHCKQTLFQCPICLLLGLCHWERKWAKVWIQRKML